MAFLAEFPTLTLLIVKKIHDGSCNCLIYSDLWIFCDTCDSKKAKTPVMRARTRAREDGFLEKFALSKSKIGRKGKMIGRQSVTSGKIFLLRCRFLWKKPTCRFIENNVSFCWKQRVVFSEVTCCLNRDRRERVINIPVLWEKSVGASAQRRWKCEVFGHVSGKAYFCTA